MKQKGVCILVCTLMVFAAVVPLASARSVTGNMQQTAPNTGARSGWTLQWSHDYGGMGHSQLAQPVGDLDGDGVNEIIVGGYENTGRCRILSYDAAQETYVEEYSWTYPGGSYDIPTGACIVDVNGDGILELCVTWGYSGADGLYAYTWDGTTLTTLDRYDGVGVDFLYDCYACDYNNDGTTEVLFTNAPYYGSDAIHVAGFSWIDGHFVMQTTWSCPGGHDMECPMISSGDVFNDGKTTIIADVSNHNSGTTAGTWALTWNTDTQSWDAMLVWNNYGGATVYGNGVADINGDGTPEIGVGSDNYPEGWLFEWDGTSFNEVWTGNYPGQYWVIESVALGDADNDGKNEFCFGTGQVHIIGWDGAKYYEKATLTEPQSMEAGMNIGDFDTDGLNELKACEIIYGGKEYIWKYISPDTIPPVTVCSLVGTMDGSEYVTNVTVTLTATDNGSGVDRTMYTLDNGTWAAYVAPFIVSDNGTHTVLYYSVDKAGNTESTQSTTFVISHHALLRLAVKGGVGITLVITCTAHTDQTMVPWSIKLHGGVVIIGKNGVSGSIAQLKSGAEVTKRLLVLGFGKTTISVAAGTVQGTATARMFLLFVTGVE
ncbi:MAG TPA: FG-GAP-like repeat-containing protein [Candidatus Thermoplasmatota archaeon]|nr:FG-GAP-like repeat-containing protein [Candidatus Thermoplasmatota archaeon]